MSFAILKLSYNHPGESSLTGGICGTGFFIDHSTAISAHHVLNIDTFTPNAGFRYCQVWILSRNGLIAPINQHLLKRHPEIDTTVVKFDKPQSRIKVYALADHRPGVGTEVYSIGHIGNMMPQVEAHWPEKSLKITEAKLDSVACDKTGYIKNILTLNVNAQDVQLQNTTGYELSFGSQVGMSGGPLINKETNEVIGLLSLGLPMDASIKTQTFAVSIGEVKKRALKKWFSAFSHP